MKEGEGSRSAHPQRDLRVFCEQLYALQQAQNVWHPLILSTCERSEDYPEFRGRYYTIDKPINEPKGVQKPHPPLWIGGGGEKVTLRVVARWGDACNVVGDPETVRHKLEVLKQHCDEVGRNYEEITKSTAVTIQLVEKEEDANKAKVASTRGAATYVGTPEMVTEELQALVEAGIDYFIVTIPRSAYDQEQQSRFAREVVPMFG